MIAIGAGVFAEWIYTTTTTTTAAATTTHWIILFVSNSHIFTAY